jgi:hypothetical protein
MHLRARPRRLGTQVRRHVDRMNNTQAALVELVSVPSCTHLRSRSCDLLAQSRLNDELAEAARAAKDETASFNVKVALRAAGGRGSEARCALPGIRTRVARAQFNELRSLSQQLEQELARTRRDTASGIRWPASIAP